MRTGVVLVGHVDHGKSTILGRLLADTGKVGEEKIRATERRAQSLDRPFEYAWLVDALVEEQMRGITISTARVPLWLSNREFVFYDAPGHKEFLRNLVSGATRSEIALLVIDIVEGVSDTTKRHAALLSLLDLKQVAVLINKIDLAGYSETKVRATENAARDLLRQLHRTPTAVIPVSGMLGENLLNRSINTPWYTGPTVVEMLLQADKQIHETIGPERFVIQYSDQSDGESVLAPSLGRHRFKPGDVVRIYPGGGCDRVKEIRTFGDHRSDKSFAGVVLENGIGIRRGDVLVHEHDRTPPVITTHFTGQVFWTAAHPIEKGGEFSLRLGTATVPSRVKGIGPFLFGGADPGRLELGDIAELLIETTEPVAVDVGAAVWSPISRFAIESGGMISGGGLIISTER